MLYIGVDGTDFIGKDTCVERFIEEFKDTLDIFYTREPGGSELGSKIRQLILDKNNTMSKRTEALLFAADRSIHIDDNIIDNKHGIVLSNRTLMSSIVYQSENDKDVEDIITINKYACNDRFPDKVIIFYIDDKDTFIERMKLSGRDKDRIESKGIDYLWNVNSKFKDIDCIYDSDKYIFIECSDSKDKVYNDFKNNILNLLLESNDLMSLFTNEGIQKAKNWFGDGEVDVELMLSSGSISLNKILYMYIFSIIK